MSLDTIRHEVVQSLAQTKEAIRDAHAALDHGEDIEKVTAAGELDFRARQKALLEERLEEIDRRLSEPETPISWFRQEWFNLRLQLEDWITHG